MFLRRCREDHFSIAASVRSRETRGVELVLKYAVKCLSILLFGLSMSCTQAAKSEGFVAGVAESGSYRASLHEDTLVIEARGSLDRLAFTTTAVARGDHDVTSTERFEASPDGVEQSWRFETRPRGSGALAVTVATDGLTFAHADATGLHFRNAGASHGIRYGHGTFIDAAGERTAIPARFEDGRIVLRVPSSVVDAARFPAVLDPIIGPEVDLDEPVGAAFINSQYAPRFAFDGTNFLAVWSDAGKVRFTRVDAAGESLDGDGFLIAGATAKYLPTVAFNGTTYLIAWLDRQGGTDLVYASRVTTAGAALDGTGFQVSAGTERSFELDVASDGDGWLLVWRQNFATGDVRGARVGEDGTVLDPATLSIAASAGNEARPSVAYGGGTYLVAYDESADLKLRTVSPAGVIGAEVSGPSGAQSDVTFDGTRFMVATASAFDIDVTSVTTAGAVVSTTEVRNGLAQTDDPTIAFDGTNFLVGWQERVGTDFGIFGQRVSAAGSTVGGVITISNARDDQNTPAVTFGGAQFLAGWSDDRYRDFGSATDVFAARVTASGTVRDPDGILLSTDGIANQQNTAVAFNGTHYLAVWSDSRAATSRDIWARRFDVSGSPVGDSFAVRLGVGNDRDPAVASNGTDFLVAWENDAGDTSRFDIDGARVSAAGVVLDDPPLEIAQENQQERDPAIAWNGTHYLVVWDTQRITGGYFGIFGSRVTSGGAILDPSGTQISGTDGWHRVEPAIAHAGSRTYLTWSDLRAGNYDIYGTPLSSLSAAVPSGQLINNSANNQTVSAVAGDGTGFFAVWEDRRTGRRALYGSRIDPAVGGTDVGGIFFDDRDAFSRAVTYDGSNYVIAWEDLGPPRQILSARVSAADGALDATSWAIATDSRDLVQPALASRGDGTSFVTYGVRLGAPFSYDARGRIVTSDADVNGAACVNDSTCASGFCVDGYCCESACGGGATDDCQACATSLTSVANGRCAPVAAGSACGDSTDDTCRNPDQCDATGSCQANDEPVGTVCGGAGVECRNPNTCNAAGACAPGSSVADGSPCGSSVDTVCDGADTCSGGVCDPNLSPSGVVCGDAGVDCREPDVCDGAGTCSDSGFAAAGTPCGSGADSECDAPDSCDTSGACVPNFASAGTACGDIGVECREDDACDGSGACADGGLAAVGTACGSSADDECDDPDSCDATGACAPNYASSGTACGDIGVDCRVDDACNGAGSCVDRGFAAVGTACGSSLDTECDDPDSCDASGACAPNHESAGVACGDIGVPCALDDACDGVGGCMDAGFASAGTACGDASDTDCTDPDSCDGAGGCLMNHLADGTTCVTGTFCLAGDACAAGVCAEGTDDACPAMEEKCSESMMMCILACGDGVLDPGEECDDGMLSDTAIDACRTDCRAARCGDGAIDTGEECDDGDLNDDGLADACRTNCLFPSCGDGVVDAGEGCDQGVDNSDAPGAICRTDCALASCGDGILDVGEDCDDGMLSDTIADACRTTCVDASCGDGVLDTGELCDDGVENSDVAPDACRANCAFPTCGDGVADTGEACDDGVDNSDTRPDACRLDCSAPACGDGVLDMEESCDEGDENSDDPGATCRTDCGTAGCGDGIVDLDEECDDGPGNSDERMDACRTGCVAARCGDGVLDTGESCDEGDANSDAPDATCRSNCATASCGDGVVDDGEECDDGATNSDVIPNVCRANCVGPRCGDGVVDIDEECDGGDDCSPACSIITVDAGTDAGIDAGDVGVDTGGGDVGGDGGCGCHVASRERPRGVWFALLLIAIVWRRSR